jgi:hypothetical protein
LEKGFMARLIAFDQQTTAALRQQLPQHQIFEHGATDVADYLIDGPETLVAVLPVDALGEAGVAVFRRVRPERATAQPTQASDSSTQSQEASPAAQPLESAVNGDEPDAIARNFDSSGTSQHLPGNSLKSSPSAAEIIAIASARTRPGGLLGLRDEAVFDEEAKLPEKRGWWKRFWDEG